MKKRILSLLCIAVLLFSCMSASASFFNESIPILTEPEEHIIADLERILADRNERLNINNVSLAKFNELILADIKERFNINKASPKEPTCCSNMNKIVILSSVNCIAIPPQITCVKEVAYTFYGCSSCNANLGMTSSERSGCGRPVN